MWQSVRKWLQKLWFEGRHAVLFDKQENMGHVHSCYSTVNQAKAVEIEDKEENSDENLEAGKNRRNCESVKASR